MLVQWGSDLQRVVLPFADLNIRFASLVVSIPQLVSLVLAIGLVFCLRMLLQKTQMGRGLRAIAESPSTAEILGVVVARLVPMVFVIGGLFAALGGMLFALNYQQVHPFMGEEVALKGISAMVIGGMGNVWGLRARRGCSSAWWKSCPSISSTPTSSTSPSTACCS